MHFMGNLGGPRTGVRELSLGVQNLSGGLVELRDQSFLSEGCRLREAAQQIAARSGYNIQQADTRHLSSCFQ